MVLLEKERKLIEERIQKIVEAKETAPSERKIVIAGGMPVLEEHEKEIKALKDMLKIIESDFKQDYKNEYLNLRETTKLPELTEKEKEKYMSSDFQRKEELRRIETRMSGIATKYFSSDRPVSYQKASDGKEINTDDFEEYETYIKMKEIINRGMNSSDYYEYLNLRDKTRMVPFEEGQYEVLMGKSAPYSREIKREPNRDQNLAVQPSEPLTEQNTNTALSTPEQIAVSTELQDYNDQETIIDVPNLNEVNQPTLPPHDEKPNDELEEITEIKECSWLKRNKKKILIALGLTAVAISAVVVITQLLPAVAAAYKAAEVAGIAGQMISNGSMWWTATAGEQVALHGANTALANMISGLTGVTSTFAETTGAWTIAGQALPQFLQTATATAAAAASKVSILQIGTSLGMLGGLGSLGAGLMPSKEKKKSTKYHEINDSIEKLKANIKSINDEDKLKLIQSISNKIIASDNISEKERNILFRKLRRAINKYKIQNNLLQESSKQQGNEVELVPSELNQANTKGTELMNPELVGINHPEVDKSNIIDVEYIDLIEPSIAQTM